MWAAKVRSVGACEYCGKTEYLNAHHIYTKHNYSVRWDLDNGICLCAGHHTFNSKFSAHKTPAEFMEWIKEKRGLEWYERLRQKARTPYTEFNYDEILRCISQHD